MDKILLGLLFGGAAIAGMHLSVLYKTGIIYDGRSIILSIAGLFGGSLVASISAIIAFAYRAYHGGAGVWAGVSTIVFCTLAGIIYRKLLKEKTETLTVRELYIFGISVHIIMLACQLLIQPFPLGLTVIKKIWLPIMIIFPVATALIGVFLRDEENRIKAEDARFKAEQRINKLNEELDAKTNRLENIIKGTDIGTWEWNIKTGETVFNERWAEIVGYTLSEISPTSIETWIRFVHPDDLIKSNEMLEKHFNGEADIYECECRMRHRDGHWVWILDRGKVIKWDEDGKPLIMFGSHLDISERKRMEEEINEAERFLSTLINNLPGFVYRCENDENWTMQYLSEQAETITGYIIDEIINNRVISYNDIIHPDYRESVKNWVDEALKDKSYFEMYYPIITKSGETKWVWEKGRGIYDDNGILKYLEGFITDITETKMKEQAYLESEGKLMAITEAAQDAIIMIDHLGNITFWNPAAERIFGYSKEDLMGKNVHKIIAPDYHYEAYKKAFPDFVLTGKGPVVGKIIELTAIRKTGEALPIELSLSSVQVKGQWHAIAIIRDITERKKAEEEKKRLEQQFLQAQKMESIGRLAGGVAHDFNNILSVIIGYGEIILSRSQQEDPFKDYVKQIVEAGKKAASLTNQLLAFSRKQILRPKNVNLNELIRHIEKMLKRIIGEDIELKCFLDHELHDVYADPNQIEQVIMNLAVNARDAMPQGGTLTIETSMIEMDEVLINEYNFFKPGHYVLLTVSDTGIGINKEDIEHIFDPFFTTKEKGTGLGLATVYGIVKQSGGNILVDSQEKKGTTFRIFLPITEEMDHAETIEEKKEIQEGKGQHILVVEDEESVRDLIHAVLSDKGFSVTVAKNGNEAIELLKQNNIKPDLLITDVVMPGMSGSELAGYVKEIIPELKIIFISGYTEETMIKHGLRDNDQSFLQKPFTVEDFLFQVQRLF